MSFSSFGLSKEIVRAVAQCGYTEATPIQAQAIPAVLSGEDLLAGAQTGTGKTAGFVLPILHRLSQTPAENTANGKAPIRALILTPTRELAAQVEQSVMDYGRYLKLTSMVMFGGVNIRPQIKRLTRRVDILVATPGRLLDHAGQGTIDLSHVEILVLDEADRMLDMGFIHDIKRVLKLLPQRRQNLLFSATFSQEIKTLANRLLNKPNMIEAPRDNITADTVSQVVHPVSRAEKRDVLCHLIKTENWHQVLVFTRTKHGANNLCKQLVKNNIQATAIHGNKSQAARTRALAEFKQGKVQVLVATDIAARGIDISELPHVVNFDLPNVPEDYVHRIGRTGRAGSNGEAVSLVCADERKFLADIEKLIGREIPKRVIEGFEPDPNEQPRPIQTRGGQSRNRGNSRGGPARNASSGKRNNSSAGHKPSQKSGGRRSNRGRSAA